MVFNRHGVRSHKLKEIKIGLAAINGAAAVPFVNYSVAAFGKTAFLPRHCPGARRAGQFLKLFFKTIGVVRDCLQSFSKSVSNDSGKVEDINPLLVHRSPEVIHLGEIPQMILFFVCCRRTSRCPAGSTLAEEKTEGDDPSWHRPSRHSERFLRNQKLRNRFLVDSPVRSPIKHNRAGHYEEGDYNQRDCRSDSYCDN